MAADQTRNTLTSLKQLGQAITKAATDALDSVAANGVDTSTQLAIIDIAQKSGNVTLTTSAAYAAALAEFGES